MGCWVIAGILTAFPTSEKPKKRKSGRSKADLHCTNKNNYSVPKKANANNKKGTDINKKRKEKKKKPEE